MNTQTVPIKLFPNVPQKLAETLINEYSKIKLNFVERRWEPSELDGGKFAEVSFRVLEWQTSGTYTALGKNITNFQDAIKKFENKTGVSDSIRLHIPRVLAAIYDIRNHRGVGHPGGDINPNEMDATFIVSASDWVMAEFIRIFNSLTVDEAKQTVEKIITRIIPLVWNVSDVKRILNPDLDYKAQMLVMLYSVYPNSLKEVDLVKWVEHSNASVFRRDVIIPAHKARLVEYNSISRELLLSPTGRKFVEDNIDLKAQN